MKHRHVEKLKITLDDIMAPALAPDAGWVTIDDLAEHADVHRETVRRRLVEAVKRGELEARMFAKPCGLSGLRRSAMHFRKVQP